MNATELTIDELLPEKSQYSCFYKFILNKIKSWAKKSLKNYNYISVSNVKYTKYFSLEYI